MTTFINPFMLEISREQTYDEISKPLQLREFSDGSRSSVPLSCEGLISMAFDKKGYMHKWHINHRKERKAYKRKHYLKHRLKEIASARAWAKANPEKKKRNDSKWRKSNKDWYVKFWNSPIQQLKQQARRMAYRSVKIPFGQICQNCKIELARERHHPDYSKPLNVWFVCRGCNVRLK